MFISCCPQQSVASTATALSSPLILLLASLLLLICRGCVAWLHPDGSHVLLLLLDSSLSAVCILLQPHPSRLLQLRGYFEYTLATPMRVEN